MEEKEVQKLIDDINRRVKSVKAWGNQLTQRQMLDEIYSLFNRLENYHYRIRHKIFYSDYELHIYRMATQISISLNNDKGDELNLDDAPYGLVKDLYAQRFEILKQLPMKIY
jgi:hypothetical protein